MVEAFQLQISLIHLASRVDRICDLHRLPKLPIQMSDSNSCSVDPSCTEVVVIRHGQTQWNVDDKFQGSVDVDLNEVGRQQSASVAKRLSQGPKISAIYSSDMKRALGTAEIIASACGGLEVLKEPELRERHLGDLEGLSYRDAAKMRPRAFEAFVSHKTDQVIPGGGESFDQVYNSCTSSLQRIAQKHPGERVVVVTHSAVIGSLYQRVRPKAKSEKGLQNTSISIFHVSDSVWEIKSWADAKHLKQTE